MNVTIIYFSQTGNTRKVAEAMAKAFCEVGHVTSTIPLKKATPQDTAACELIGVGTPCFSSQAPTPIKSFLSTLPQLNNHRGFVFATSGGAPGRVLSDLSGLLQSKGADVIGGFLCHGEVRHPAPCLIGRLPNRPNTEDLARARRFALAVAEHVSAGRSGPVAESRPDTFMPKEKFYNLVASLSKAGFLRLVLPEPAPNWARCNQCNWCVHECPVQNITLQPYPVLGHRCIRCYRCLTGCPQKAFVADWKLGNLAILSFYSETFIRWFGDLKPGERIY
jgi:flavodoxin/Pyruvate/2-oxoacid:ferredoxin oxidoreductase delta subunit